MEEQKCFFCEHSIRQHDFSHRSECRAGNCDCIEFIFETRKCNLCDKLVKREELSELMLNPVLSQVRVSLLG